MSAATQRPFDMLDLALKAAMDDSVPILSAMFRLTIEIEQSLASPYHEIRARPCSNRGLRGMSANDLRETFPSGFASQASLDFIAPVCATATAP
ncbi:MAG: hypothetical protein AAF449_14200 [Myxococcota bacterium]